MRVSVLGAILFAPAAFAQSSSAASGSASSAAASASASASGSSGGSSSNSSSTGAYLTQVLGALTAANLTSLVGVASSIANTTNGMALLSMLASGNKTVFAPNNDAFANVSSAVANNPDMLTTILSYHILNNTYTANNSAMAPNHTIARTLLNGGNYTLPGNRSAPLVLSTMNNTLMINEATMNISTLGGAMAANLMVYVIPAIIQLPQTIADVAMSLFPTLAGVISQSGLLQPLQAAKGITVFAPTDAALSAVVSSLPNNATIIQTVLANHVINGSVVYSTNLASANYTSAAGEPFTFMTNSSGSYVMSANSTAKIVQADIIIQNGVVHLIDGVLLNTMSNASAAASAYSAGQASATGTDNASPATSSASASGSGSASKAAAGQVAPLQWSSIIGGAIAVAGVAVGGGYILA